MSQMTTRFQGWDTVDPTKHHAFYMFHFIEQAQEVLGGVVLKALIVEFDRVWQNKVLRQRSIVKIT